ncbi:hypothetical protein JCM8097_003785 [Rhodosporidiobolus ruineniae]
MSDSASDTSEPPHRPSYRRRLPSSSSSASPNSSRSPSPQPRKHRRLTSIGTSKYSPSSIRATKSADGEGESSELSELSDEDKDGDDEDDPLSQFEMVYVKNGGGEEVWTEALDRVLLEGLKLIPNTTGNFFFFRGRKVGRTRLLSEYIRRRTGDVRSTRQVDRRIRLLRSKAGDDEDLHACLNEAKLDKDHLPRRDWDAFLGPDLFPSSAPAQPKKKKRIKFKPSKSSPEQGQKPSKPAEKKERSQSSASKTIKSLPSSKRNAVPNQPKSQRKPSPARSSTLADRLSPTPDFSSLTPAPQPKPSVLSLAAVDSAVDSDPLTAAHLEAFFLATSPLIDHHASASLLLRLGIDSLQALGALMLADEGVLEVLFERVKTLRDVEAEEVDELTRAVEAARRAYLGAR